MHSIFQILFRGGGGGVGSERKKIWTAHRPFRFDTRHLYDEHYT